MDDNNRSYFTSLPQVTSDVVQTDTSDVSTTTQTDTPDVSTNVQTDTPQVDDSESR